MMKKIWNYIFVALAGLSLLSCNIKELPEETPSTDGYTYTIAVAGDTKVYINDDHMTWVENDQIGWYTDKTGNSVINMNTDPRSFEVSSNAAMAAGAMIYAYAPYMEGYEFTDVTKAPLFIPVEQNNIISNAMPMVSLPIELSDAMSAQAGTPVGQASFVNLGAVIEYNVYTSNADYAGETINSVTFTATSPIAGDFKVDLTAVTADNIPAPTGLTDYTVLSNTEATVGASKAEGVKVYQVVAPGTISGTVTVTTDAAVYEYSISDMVFNRGKIKTLNVNLGSANAVRTNTNDIEDLLTATTWVLKGVKEAGVSRSTSIGNKVTFNTDENHSLSFDCSANDGQTFDHTWTGGLIAPNKYGEVSAMSWWVYPYGGEFKLTIADGFLLVFVQDKAEDEYTIKELTEEKLTVDIVSYGETWTLEFEATEGGSEPTSFTYHHDFAQGDWGIGSDPTGHPDGDYYLDWGMTNPDTLDGVSWTWSVTNNNNPSYDQGGLWEYDWAFKIGSYGMRVSDFLLSSNSFSGTITKVTLSGCSDEGFTVNCTVGGNSFGSAAATPDNNGEWSAEINGNGSGDLVIALHATTEMPIWLYSIEVEYGSGSAPI